MITFVKAFKTTTGKTFEELAAAQEAELVQLFPADVAATVAQSIIANREKIIDILTTTPKSRPRGRRINGGHKKPKVTTP